jgi:hypothetical protein
MNFTAALLFLTENLGALRGLTLGQWLSVGGSALGAAGASLALNPREFGAAFAAGAGAAAIAIIHLLQPSPKQRWTKQAK